VLPKRKLCDPFVAEQPPPRFWFRRSCQVHNATRALDVCTSVVNCRFGFKRKEPRLRIKMLPPNAYVCPCTSVCMSERTSASYHAHRLPPRYIPILMLKTIVPCCWLRTCACCRCSHCHHGRQRTCHATHASNDELGTERGWRIPCPPQYFLH
jgi:hypothetical protein